MRHSTRRAFLLGVALSPFIATSLFSRTRKAALFHSVPDVSGGNLLSRIDPAPPIARPWMGAITDTSVAFAADLESKGQSTVRIEVSSDRNFRTIVSADKAVARSTPQSASENWLSVNHVVNDLSPGTRYWARFHVDGWPSPEVLTFITAPRRAIAAPYCGNRVL